MEGRRNGRVEGVGIGRSFVVRGGMGEGGRESAGGNGSREELTKIRTCGEKRNGDGVEGSFVEGRTLGGVGSKWKVR